MLPAQFANYLPTCALDALSVINEAGEQQGCVPLSLLMELMFVGK